MSFSREAAQTVALEAVVGLAIGSILGVILRLVTKRKVGGAIVDAILGAIAFAGGATGTALVPWRLNTVTQRIGDTIVTTTTKRYQNPYQIAFVLAVFLPLLWEAYCFRRDRRAADRVKPK